MHLWVSTRFVALFVFALLCGSAVAQERTVPTIKTNNNETPAGIWQGNALHLDLNIDEGEWHPEAEDGPGVVVQAFAEEGKLPQIPGPMIRVREGTKIRIRIRNKCASTAKVYGFHQRPGAPDQALEIPTGQARDVNFQPGTAGTYYYWATTSGEKMDERYQEDSQLSGAIIVDPVKQKNSALMEPVFVLGHWYREGDPHANPPIEDRELHVINGKMWPYTEHLQQDVGQPMRTRWINPTDERHPMHLHGTYFAILNEGDGERDIAYEPQQRPFVATHALESGHTMLIGWTALHAGNWLFHCHILYHTDSGLGLSPPKPEEADHSIRHMSGLAVGITALAAKDGADLPPSQAVYREATQFITTGETYDYEWTPLAGDYRLEGRSGGGQLGFAVDIPVE